MKNIRNQRTEDTALVVCRQKYFEPNFTSWTFEIRQSMFLHCITLGSQDLTFLHETDFFHLTTCFRHKIREKLQSV